MNGSAPTDDGRDSGTGVGAGVPSDWPQIADYWPPEATRHADVPGDPHDGTAADPPVAPVRPAWHGTVLDAASGTLVSPFTGRRRSRRRWWLQRYLSDHPGRSRPVLASSLTIVMLTVTALVVMLVRRPASDSTGALTEPPATALPGLNPPIDPGAKPGPEPGPGLAAPSTAPGAPSSADPPTRPPADDRDSGERDPDDRDPDDPDPGGGDPGDRDSGDRDPGEGDPDDGDRDDGGGDDGGDDGDGDRNGGDDGGDDDGVITAPVDGRRTAAFDLIRSADNVNVRMAALGSDLFRVSTPDAGNARPSVTVVNSMVRVSPARGDGTNTTDITLNASVRWSVGMSAGVRRGVFDLGGGTISAVRLARSARLDLTLPRPVGTLPVRMAGGVSSLRVHTPDVPVSVDIRAGAGLVVINGRPEAGVRRGTTFTPARFAGTTNRIDLDALGSVGVLRVDDNG